VRLIRRLPGPLAILLAVALVEGLCWTFAVPPLQGADESAHVEYVQKIVEDGEIPWSNDFVLPRDYSPSVSTEQRLVWVWAGTEPLRGNAAARPLWTSADEHVYEQRAKRLPPGGRGDGSNTTSFHTPPLYYLYASIPYAIAHGGSFFDRLYLMRLFNLPLILLTVALTWLLAGEVFGRRRGLQTLAAGAVALHPVLFDIATRVSPDALLIPLVALALYLMALLVNRGPRPRLIAALVATCAAAGFTQGRGLMLVLPALFALAVALWRAHAPPDPRRRRALLGAVAGGFAVAGGAIALFATRGSVGGLGGFGSYLWQFYLPALPGMSDPAGPHWTVQQVWMDRFFASYVQFEVFLPTDFVGVLRDAAWLGLALCAAGVVRHRDAIWARRELVAVLVFALVGAVYFLHGAAFHSLVTDPLDPVITGRYVLGFLPLMGIGIALAVTALSRRLGAGVGAAVLAGGALLQLSALGLVVARFYA